MRGRVEAEFVDLGEKDLKNIAWPVLVYAIRLGAKTGDKLNLISLDDGYSPPKTVEQVRRLVEEEQVAFLFRNGGTPTNAAFRQYCNDNKVPQLFVATGASMFSDPEHFPWTIGFIANYQTEALIFAKHIPQTKPGAKIGVLYQNDGFGKDYLIGLKDVLGPDRAGMVIKEVSYEVSEPTVDSQIVTLQGSGADVFLIAATSKAAAQAIRKTFDLGWIPFATCDQLLPDPPDTARDLQLRELGVLWRTPYRRTRGTATHVLRPFPSIAQNPLRDGRLSTPFARGPRRRRSYDGLWPGGAPASSSRGAERRGDPGDEARNRPNAEPLPWPLHLHERGPRR